MMEWLFAPLEARKWVTSLNPSRIAFVVFTEAILPVVIDCLLRTLRVPSGGLSSSFSIPLGSSPQ